MLDHGWRGGTGILEPHILKGFSLLHVRPAVTTDIYDISPRLRTADLSEIEAASGLPPEVAILPGLGPDSRCIAIEYDHQVCGLFGVVGRRGPPGIVWMVATPELERNRFQFLRSCRSWIDRLRRPHPFLFNIVDSRNTLHLRWLEWAGAEFTGGSEIRRGVLFKEFVIV